MRLSPLPRLPPLSERKRQQEWMDDPSLDARLHHHALVGLGRINRLSLTASSFWRAISPMLGRLRSPRVLDVACGGGDVALGLVSIARRHGCEIDLSVADVSPFALRYAQDAAKARGISVRTMTHDALAGDWPGGPYDLVINSLMLHHLDETQVVTVLSHMRDAARLGVVVNDLLRSRRGWLLAKLGVHLLSRSPVVHLDGPRSVEGAFSTAEFRELSERAGLSGFTLHRTWPARTMLIWRRA